MRRLSCLAGSMFALAFVCQFAAFNAAAAIVAGRTPGAAAVSNFGQATYSIPLALPAGTNGLTPTVSLEYRHDNPGGLLGVGWTIGGLSAIQRCHRTVAQDYSISPASDLRYCLDGVRLRVSNGLPYNNSSAEYRTEIESFSRIKRFGGSPNWSPDYFTVESSDGLKREYGATTDSRGGWAWRLNKIIDRSGNVISFTYEIDGNSRRIQRIIYNSNPGQAVPASHEVLFVYENRPSNEVDLAYVFNTPVRNIVRLDRVDLLYNSSLIKRYELTYEPYLSSAGHSRLASIQECGVGGTDCFAATTFAWQNGTAGLGSEVNAPVLSCTFMDINGDGRADCVYKVSSILRFRLALSSGGFGPEVSTNTTWNMPITPFDYNGDGRQDLLGVTASSPYYWAILPGTENGMGALINTGVPSPSGCEMLTDYRGADMNGDGLGDIVYAWQECSAYANSLQVRVRLATQAGVFGADQILYEQGYYYPEWSPGASFIGTPGEVIDLDGDGREDALLTEVYSMVRISLDGFEIDSFDSDFSNSTVFDLNGDGATDFVYKHYTGQLRVRFGGVGPYPGALPELIAPTPTGTNAAMTAIDWNGDGKDDLGFGSPSGTLRIMVSTGDTLLPPVDTGIPGMTMPGPRADINGDSLQDLRTFSTGKYRLHPGVKPDLMISATDGYGVAASFTYQPITNPGIHTKGTGAQFPDRDIQDGTHVVATLTATDGSAVGTTVTQSFTYEGLRFHAQGRGYLGFAKKIRTDGTLGYNQKHEESFKQNFPYVGLVSNYVMRQSSGQAIIDESRTWSALTLGLLDRWFPYVSSSQVKRYEVGGTYNGTHISTVSSSVAAIDSTSGLITDQTITTTEVATGLNAGAVRTRRLLHSSLFNDTTNWCLGRPQTTQTIASHTLPDGNTITRTESATWDGLKCRPTQRQIEPAHATLQVTIAYGYDAFGNVATETVTGVGMTPRTTQLNWSPRGQLPISVQNALGHLTSHEWRYDFGLPTKITDPNLLETRWDYDSFGRPTLRTRPDQTRTAWTWTACPGCGPLTRLRLLQDEQDATGIVVLPSVLDLDQFDRPYATQTTSVTGEWTTIQTEFDARGRPIKQRVPYWSAVGPGGYALFGYDQIDRTSSVGLYSATGVLQHQTSYAFNGLTAARTNPLLAVDTLVQNAWGDTVRSTDAVLSNTNYQYNAFGQLTRVTDALGNLNSTVTYNVRGMKTNQFDIDMGAWIFAPNALGEIASQTDAKGQVSTFAYDALSRMTDRTEAAGSSSFVFGNSATAKNIGQLESLSGFGYTENFTYDSVGRLSRRRIVSDATYDFDYTYNANGSLHTLQYPTSTTGYRLTLEHEYSYGQLKKIKDALVPSTVLWEVNAVDAAGGVIDFTLGANIKVVSGFDPLTGLLEYRQTGVNGGSAIQNFEYDWNAVGDLTKRADLNQTGSCSGLGYTSKLCETFVYDLLERLDYSQRNGALNLDLAYDAIGNITSKTSPTVSAENVGSYNYTTAQSGCTYYTHNQRHAVRKAGTKIYCYDANGNMTKRAGATVSWYSYNLPNTINQSGGNYSQFFYGPERNRWKQVANYSGTTETTIYIGGLTEKVTKGGVTTWKHYILAPTGTAALYLRRSGGTPLEETYYLTSDHLGSTHKIIAAAGVVTAVSESFGAFGQRRGSNWTGVPTSANWTAIGATTRDAYTGHEDIDNLTLIHMNGRVFDPKIARFVSADPFVQFPFDGQSLNRYSYVRNGPLSATDPSGFAECGYTQDVVEVAKCRDRKRQQDHNTWLQAKYNWSAFNAFRDECGWFGDATLCATKGRFVTVPASPIVSTVGGSLADEVPSLADFPSTEALTEQPRESQLLPWRNGRQFWRDADAILVALGPAGGLAAGTVRGTGRLLVGTRQLFAAKDSTRGGITYLYQKVSAAGEHLKFGITNNPLTRYTAEELAGGRLRIVAIGLRQNMLALERKLHETLPIGGEEAQRFYIKIQEALGLRPPPYQ